MAGRVLRPLRTITAATQQISEASLHRRLDLPGPRDELRQLADTIDGLLARLQAAFDAQRQFVANASHELRTPLTAARALLEMVLSDPHANVEAFRETCRYVLQEHEQQEQLIDALLALALSQRGLERRELVDLADIVNDELDRRRSEASARRLRVESSVEPAVIEGDRRLVQRLVSNLVENAIRHNQDRGDITIIVESRAGGPTLRIANSGPSIPRDGLDRLLQPFQRLSPDRTGSADGLGLGLWIVAAVAAAHDASLTLTPRARGGLDVAVGFKRSTGGSAIAAAPPLTAARSAGDRQPVGGGSTA